jgi:hypothetical protein
LGKTCQMFGTLQVYGYFHYVLCGFDFDDDTGNCDGT